MVSYDEQLAEYNQKYQEYLELKAQYDIDYQAYLDGEEAYRNCLAETTTKEIVNPKLTYQLSVTSQSNGESMMQGSASGFSLTIKYSSDVVGVRIGNATLSGRFNMTFTSLGGGRVRATLQSVTLEQWQNVSTGASYTVPSFPSLRLKQLNGSTVWELLNYDPGKTRTVAINQTIPINQSWDLNYGQSIPKTQILKILDEWEFSQTGDVSVSFTNTSTIEYEQIPANTDAQCQLLRKPKPTEPVPPTPPVDTDIKPWAIRKSNTWKTLDRPSGFFKIRRAVNYVNKSTSAISTVGKVNQGTHRIRRSGNWLGQNKIGND